MKIGFGLITKDFLTAEPIDQFIRNAKKFGHAIDSVIIGYGDQINREVIAALEKEVKVHSIHIRKSVELDDYLTRQGMTQWERTALIGNIHKDSDGRVPYGNSRNHIIMKAIKEHLDVLIFIDTDVYPEVVIHEKDLLKDEKLFLRKTSMEHVFIQEVDFVKEHLKALSDKHVVVSTSDYTGYYIIPPMAFEGMDDLFYGLKKESAYNYIKDSYQHNCLSLDHGIRRQPFRTEKVLGGNVAIKLELFKSIVPFFSSAYYMKDTKYLTRGEDTVLALQMKEVTSKKFVDIDMKIFHNTYGHFPTVPDILKDQCIKDRFFNASMGWLGRNPFLNYLSGIRKEYAYEQEHKRLIAGSQAIYKYLKDERFLLLPEAHDLAYAHLDTMIKEYEAFKTSWFNWIRRLQ
ncbi:MAG: hypothetical protein JXR88_08455 [Clostridia bacterium]|nr:hypothetical protein [Clostridia bacterium]